MMRYLVGFLCVSALVGALPQSVDAQDSKRTEQEPVLGLEQLEGSDLQWLQWLLVVEGDVAPDLLVQELAQTAPPSNGSWLRLELDRTGMRVVPRRTPEKGRSRAFRVGVGVGVAVGVLAVLAVGATFAVANEL